VEGLPIDVVSCQFECACIYLPLSLHWTAPRRFLNSPLPPKLHWICWWLHTS
jgi:hypothetical protein